MQREIAIDFDGTLFENCWPLIGPPNMEVINAAKAERAAGAKLILYTMREGELLDQALDACRAQGLEFDAVNDSTEERKEAYADNPRKVGATEYWDDCAVPVIDGKLCRISSSQEKLYREAVNKWGADMQLVVAAEELSELQKEICKTLRGKMDIEHIAEEMADCEIVLEQMKYTIFRNVNLVSEWKQRKLHRLARRIAYEQREEA